MGLIKATFDTPEEAAACMIGTMAFPGMDSEVTTEDPCTVLIEYPSPEASKELDETDDPSVRVVRLVLIAATTVKNQDIAIAIEPAVRERLAESGIDLDELTIEGGHG
jgi:hypothetical protein